MALSPREHWRVSMDGLARLDALGRLDAAGTTSLLRWKRYENEIPGRRINNIWNQKMAPSDKRYVVQTSDSVIERCVLMATDPGDLVLDPTCGGATTALAAEKWGRRWIPVTPRQSPCQSPVNGSPPRPSRTGRWPTQQTAHAKQRNCPASRKRSHPRADGATTPPKASSTSASLRCRQVSWRMTRTRPHTACRPTAQEASGHSCGITPDRGRASSPGRRSYRLKAPMTRWWSRTVTSPKRWRPR